MGEGLEERQRIECWPNETNKISKEAHPRWSQLVELRVEGHTTWILNRVCYRLIGEGGNEVLEVKVILQTTDRSKPKGSSTRWLASRTEQRRAMRYLERRECESFLYSSIRLVRHPAGCERDLVELSDGWPLETSCLPFAFPASKFLSW
jgi:hypothetical protein